MKYCNDKCLVLPSQDFEAYLTSSNQLLDKFAAITPSIVSIPDLQEIKPLEKVIMEYQIVQYTELNNKHFTPHSSWVAETLTGDLLCPSQ